MAGGRTASTTTTHVELTLTVRSQAVKTQMGGNQPNLGLFPDIQSLRDWITNAKKAMSAAMGPKIPGVVEHDEQVEMRDGHKITCRIHKPENPPSGGSPLMVSKSKGEG